MMIKAGMVIGRTTNRKNSDKKRVALFRLANLTKGSINKVNLISPLNGNPYLCKFNNNKWLVKFRDESFLLQDGKVNIDHQNNFGYTALIEALALIDGSEVYQQIVQELFADNSNK